jgi:probable F420-dependent oxidoreductase
MKLSLAIPIDIDNREEFQNGEAVRIVSQAVEKAGADAAFITDHPAPTAKWRDRGGHDALDPFAGLAFVAAHTTKLRLMTHLVVLPYRNPFITAKGAATLDLLSDGRLILAIGVGYLRGEYQALGVNFDTRGAATDEAIEVMKAVWSGAVVEREGATFTAADIRVRPLPVQKPNPPIWSGGNSVRAMKRAAVLGDGWCPIFATGALSKTARTDDIASVADLRAKIDKVGEFRQAAGRMSEPFDICIGPQVGIRECNASEAQHFIEQSEELGQNGVGWVTCTLPHGDRKTFLDALQWFSEELAPKVHALPTKAAW